MTMNMECNSVVRKVGSRGVWRAFGLALLCAIAPLSGMANGWNIRGGAG